MNDKIIEKLFKIPEGYSDGLYLGNKYSCTKQSLYKGKNVKIYAENLSTKNIVSGNIYFIKGNYILKPCEMSDEKVIDFILNYKSI